MKYIKTYENFKTVSTNNFKVGDYVKIKETDIKQYQENEKLKKFILSNIGIIKYISEYEYFNADVFVEYINIPNNIIGFFDDNRYISDIKNLSIANESEIEEFKIKLKANKYNL